MSNYLTTDGLKKFSLLPEAPLRPEARGICHNCHMVNPALLVTAAAELDVDRPSAYRHQFRPTYRNDGNVKVVIFAAMLKLNAKSVWTAPADSVCISGYPLILWQPKIRIS